MGVAQGIDRPPWLRRALLRTGAAVAAVMLAACATTRPPPAPESATPPPAWQGHRHALLAIDHWAINARVAVRKGNTGMSALLRWAQDKDAYRVSIYGPFGQGAVQLHGDRDGGELRTSDDKTYRARNMQRLLYERLGWPIPVLGLRYWARGLPVPDVATRFGFDDQGRLAWVEQFGWHVSYPGYRSVNGVELPRRITIERDDLRVKLVIDQWHIKT